MKFINVDLDTDAIRLVPVCDTQHGAPGVHREAFREYIEDEVLDRPEGRILGVGDYTDGMSPSNRKVLRANFEKGILYDTPADMILAGAREQVGDFLHDVRGTEDRWDALLSGHHYWEYNYRAADDALYSIRNTDYDIAQRVHAPYMGRGLTMVTYKFPAIRRQRRQEFRVLLTHGEGASSTFSGALNTLEKMMRAFRANVFLTGHHHKSVAARAVVLEEDEDDPTGMSAQETRLIGAGSWMRGFVKDTVTYPEEGLMVPLAIGSSVIDVRQGRHGLRARVEV